MKTKKNMEEIEERIMRGKIENGEIGKTKLKKEIMGGKKKNENAEKNQNQEKSKIKNHIKIKMKMWSELVKDIDGKVKVMKTVDKGIIRSTRKMKKKNEEKVKPCLNLNGSVKKKKMEIVEI